MLYDNYITETYYLSTYAGPAPEYGAFATPARRASAEIDRLTFSRVRTEGLDSFDDDTQDAIKQATCAIAEALIRIDNMTEGTGVATTSEKVGSFSYTVDPAKLEAIMEDAYKTARAILLPTGLLYAGI